MSEVIVQEQGVTRAWRSIAGQPQGPSGIDGGGCGEAHQPVGVSLDTCLCGWTR